MVVEDGIPCLDRSVCRLHVNLRLCRTSAVMISADGANQNERQKQRCTGAGGNAGRENVARMATSVRYIVVFDGVCSLCTHSVAFILAHERDTAIRFTTAQSAVGRELLSEFGLDEENLATFVFIEGGAAHIRSDAALAVANNSSVALENTPRPSHCPAAASRLDLRPDSTQSVSLVRQTRELYRANAGTAVSVHRG